MKTEDLKYEMSPRIAKLILGIRMALIQDDHDEAWHNIYQIVSPDYDVFDNILDERWKEVDNIAKSDVSQFKSLPEITDEEISGWAERITENNFSCKKTEIVKYAAIIGAKWYRSELKKRMNESR